MNKGDVKEGWNHCTDYYSGAGGYYVCQLCWQQHTNRRHRVLYSVFGVLMAMAVAAKDDYQAVLEEQRVEVMDRDMLYAI